MMSGEPIIGVLKAESPLARLWRNRLVPLKTLRPVVLWIACPITPGGRRAAGFVHVADLRDASPEYIAEIVALVPDLAPDANQLAQVRELSIPENHFEAVV